MATVIRRSRLISLFFILIFFFKITLVFPQEKTTTGQITHQTQDSLNDVDVVNIGYGTLKQREVTGSIGTVRSDGFNRGYIDTPVQLIQGKVAGLDISKPGGDPNGSFYLRLRGLNTINANTQPLVVVDGLIEASLDNVDSNDIESITILKDGASAAIYGTRGSNGVILVTTKKGKRGVTVIDYNVYTTAEKVAKNTPMMNASEWRALNTELGGLGTDFGSNTDWFKEIEQTAISQVHNISMSGGTNKTSYRASVNYRQGEGVEIKTGYTQLNGRINIIQKALNDKLTLDLNLAATERESQFGFPEAFRYAAIFNPTAPVKSSDPEFVQYDGYFQQILFDYYNPVSILELNTNEGKNRILNLSLKGTYEILKGLNVDAFYSVQNIGTLAGKYFDKNDYWGGINRNGLASRQEDNSSNRLFESTVHFNNDLSSSININALGGYSYQDFTNEGFYAEGGNFLTDDFTFNNFAASLDFKNGLGTITSYKNSNKLVSFFGRVNININDKWFLTGSARYDGSSRFGANKKWGLFPSLGAGADLAKLMNISFLDNLKLRLNYGITGNQPGESYMSLQRMGPQWNSWYNGTFRPFYSLISNSNPDLKWEKKGEFDAGIDFSVFKNRLSGSFDYYSRTASDLIYQYDVPVPPNPYYYAWINIGKIKSSGLELTLNFNVIKKPNFSYNISFTRSHNLKNTLISLSGKYNGTSLIYGTRVIGDFGSPGHGGEPLVRSEEGKPIGEILTYVYEGIDASGIFVFKDVNGDGAINGADRVVTGNGLPEFLTGFGNMLTYNRWDLNIFFRSVSGHNLLNSYRSFYEVPNYIAYYNLTKTATNMRNTATGELMRITSGVLTSKDIENASFISLDNICLGYNFILPKSPQFSKLRLYLAGNNLFYITRYKGSDPNPRYADSEPYYGTYNNPLIPGVDRRNTWPRTRSVTFGANVVF